MFKVFVEVQGEEGEWHTNALEFATVEYAEAYGRDLSRRWLAVLAFQIRDKDTDATIKEVRL